MYSQLHVSSCSQDSGIENRLHDAIQMVKVSFINFKERSDVHVKRTWDRRPFIDIGKVQIKRLFISYKHVHLPYTIFKQPAFSFNQNYIGFLVNGVESSSELFSSPSWYPRFIWPIPYFFTSSLVRIFSLSIKLGTKHPWVLGIQKFEQVIPICKFRDTCSSVKEGDLVPIPSHGGHKS